MGFKVRLNSQRLSRRVFSGDLFPATDVLKNNRGGFLMLIYTRLMGESGNARVGPLLVQHHMPPT